MSDNGSRPAQVHGLPKSQKEKGNYSRRPAMSATTAVVYGLGKIYPTCH